MGIGNYPGFVHLLPEELLDKYVPEEHARFKELVKRYHISLGQWANALDQGDDGMAIDAMDIEFEDEDGVRHPALYEMSEEEYEEMVFNESVDALNAVTEAFKERTGVEIDLWCQLASDYGTSEDLDLDEAYWIMVDCIQFKPEVKALGVDYWMSYRDYVITC